MSHQEVIELLPWYVNDTLQPTEKTGVEAHLRDCRECTGELEQMRALRQAMVAAGERIPEPSPFQFARALARVEEYERERTSGRLWWLSPRFARLAIAVQFLVILVLVGLLLQRRGSEFTTATGPSAGARIAVRFQDGVTEEMVREVVQEIHGSIVGGPSALGLYTVQVPEQDHDAVTKIIEKLRQNQRVIRVAELAP